MAARRMPARVIASGIAAASLAALSVQVLAAPSTWLEVDGNILVTNPPPAGIQDWANSGPPPPSLTTCPAGPGGVDMPGSGGLFNCGSPGTGGAPPNPPTLTAAAAADPTIVSTLFVVDPLSSDTTACGSGDSTVLGGGLKNGVDINAFTYGTSSVPAKDDLGNGYAVSRIRADGHHELFFAAERRINNGDSHMDFEFLQYPVSRTGTCSGKLAGHRTQGDLLLAVDFTMGGSLAGSSLYQWHCKADPGTQPAAGTVCDPLGSKPVPHYQLIAPLPGTLTFLVNAATIDCGGWVCRDAITGNSTQIAPNDFMEGGIDLGVLPSAVCFNTMMPHTRTSAPFTAGLKDFSGPTAFRTCLGNVIPGLPNTGLVGSDGPYYRLAPAASEAPPAATAPPIRLLVPKLGIAARVEAVGVDRQGNLAAPSALKDVAWYTGGAAPGDPGSAIINGHLGVRPGQAVFWDLHRIRAGDLIVVMRSDGTRVTFVVDGVRTYPRTASVPQLFINNGTPELWLITCSGKWDYGQATYDDRLIVHAHVVDDTALPSGLSFGVREPIHFRATPL